MRLHFPDLGLALIPGWPAGPAGRQPVAVLTRIPATPGKRRTWGDVDGSIGPEFDEIPPDLKHYS